jgi:glutamine cyclotransferase
MLSIIKRSAAQGLVLLALLLWPAFVPAAAPVLKAVVHSRLPHDPAAFTQGLVYHQGVFYESTGLYGHSSLRRVDPATGRVLSRCELPRAFFGEGLALVGDTLFQLTWREGRVLLAGVTDLAAKGELPLSGEGWGVCVLGDRLVVSDGSDRLFFYDPAGMKPLGSLAVSDDGVAVSRLNELETVAGRIWANVWGENRIAVIDPATGRVVAWVDCSGLRPGVTPAPLEDVLNGIAHDPATGRVWVTGKNWSEMFEITVPGLPTGGGLAPLSGPAGHRERP